MKLLSFFEKGNGKTSRNEDIIQLVSCPANGKVCTQNLSEINHLLSTAQQSRFSKEYGRSIYKMKEALAIADEIKVERCANCACLFRTTILASMDNMKDELEEMSRGYFKSRYRESFRHVSKVIREMKEAKANPGIA